MDPIALDGLRFLAVLGTDSTRADGQRIKEKHVGVVRLIRSGDTKLVLIAQAACPVLNVFLSEVSDASKRLRKSMPATQDWIQLL